MLSLACQHRLLPVPILLRCLGRTWTLPGRPRKRRIRPQSRSPSTRCSAGAPPRLLCRCSHPNLVAARCAVQRSEQHTSRLRSCGRYTLRAVTAPQARASSTTARRPRSPARCRLCPRWDRSCRCDMETVVPVCAVAWGICGDVRNRRNIFNSFGHSMYALSRAQDTMYCRCGQCRQTFE